MVGSVRAGDGDGVGVGGGDTGGAGRGVGDRDPQPGRVEHPDRGGQQRQEAGIVSLSLYFASLCVSLQGTWLDQSMPTLVLESAGQIVFCFDWTVLVCADL